MKKWYASLSLSHPPFPFLALTHIRNKQSLPPYCSRCVKRERDTTLVFYDMVVIIVPASLCTAAALLQALFNCTWALTLTLSWFSASAEEWHHPPWLQALFVMKLPQEGSSLMQGNLSGCNMRLPFQQCSLWSWQLLVLYAAPLVHAAHPFKAYFSEVSNWYTSFFFSPIYDFFFFLWHSREMWAENKSFWQIQHCMFKQIMNPLITYVGLFWWKKIILNLTNSQIIVP